MNARFSSFAWTFVLMIVFRLVLDVAYVTSVSKIYEYEGFYLNLIPANYVFSFAALIGIYFLFEFFCKSRFGSAKLSLIGIMLIFYVVPTTSLWALKGGTMHTALALGGFVVIIAGAWLAEGFIPQSLPAPRIGPGPLALGLLFYSMVSVAALYMTGVRFGFNFDFSLAYETRAGWNDAIGGSRLIGYLVMWQAKVINIALVVVGLRLKGPWFGLAVLGVAYQLLLFGTSGHKTYFFSMILAGALYYGSRVKVDSWRLFALLGAGAATLGLILSLNPDTQLSGSILTRRLFFVPPAVGEMHVEFFSRPWNEFVKLSHSILFFLFDYPYYENFFHAISREMYDKEANVNTGIFGDGFDNFGTAGTLVWSFAFGWYAVLCDRLTRETPLAIKNCLIIVPAMSFVNSGLLTSVLTHGALLSVLLCWILPWQYFGNKGREHI